ncbi:hypothetical protein [Sphaerisporangium fuscum]|uniref:hypothetical protein n=1 Tax=Sphaerisporangium fuscum TaxID=2835868 RepID=UPI001BDBF2C0|nr:hypothetical protein [Sphaerisporangium fuscum]
MDMSWQTTFAVACATVLAAVVPGTLGYATARVETAERQRQEVMRLHAEVQAARKAVHQVSTPCGALDQDGASYSGGSRGSAPTAAREAEGRPQVTRGTREPQSFIPPPGVE